MSSARFISDDFLLESKSARRLYHEVAAPMPILDYHCHLPPREMAENRRYADMTELWLEGDHYKWRAMRANGVNERYCTGEAPPREKFRQWAATVPRLLRNPLYHWTHLELARYFGLDDRLLSPDTEAGIWTRCNEQLAQPDFSCRSLMTRSRVTLVCTTDDPADSLDHHRALAADPEFGIQVLPAWRPDRGMAVADVGAFNGWLDRLAAAADVDIRDWASYWDALRRRHAAFAEAGCRLSDHGLEAMEADDFTEAQAAAAFAKLREGRGLDAGEAGCFRSAMLHEFAVLDHERGWTQQFHLGAMRNNNTRMFERLGPDIGFDSIGDFEQGRPLARFLDRLDRDGRLTRTVLYNLNPRDNALMAAMLGNFQDGETPGKMQWGSAWWFLDQKDGMERQLETLSQLGLLSRFVGMLTDSRSFLSYTRHEYFRRILCNLLGRDMESGSLPNDFELVGGLVRDVAYNNAVRYFGFELEIV